MVQQVSLLWGDIQDQGHGPCFWHPDPEDLNEGYGYSDRLSLDFRQCQQCGQGKTGFAFTFNISAPGYACLFGSLLESVVHTKFYHFILQDTPQC